MSERGRQGAAPLGGHTPGPWQLGARDEQILYHSPDGVWQFIADTHGVGEDAIANARLIASAPELLQVAGAAYLWLSTHGTVNEVTDGLRAAIAKARGEQ